MNKEKLLAGISRKDITPEIGTVLFGYPNRRKAQEVNDRLTVTTLFLSCNDTKFILVSTAILFFRTEQADEIREKISNILKVPYENIYLHAFHTHSAPETSTVSSWSIVNSEYCKEILEPAVIRSCIEASGNPVPVKVGVSCKRSNVGINRRQYLRNGEMYLGQNAWGIYDPWMTVIRFISGETPVANIIHYGAHCTAAGDTPAISRDWPGIMIDRVEETAGGITMFLTGSEGDVGPRLSNGETAANIQYMNEIGNIAAHDAVSILREIKDFRSINLNGRCGKLRLPYNVLPQESEADQKISFIKENELDDLVSKIDLHHYTKVKEVYSKQLPIEKYTERDQSIISIGPVAFVPAEYEMFSSISLRLRDHSPFQYTLLLSNTNGYRGYMPSKDQIALGGYEVYSRKNEGAFVLTDDADDYFVESNLKILDELFCEQ